MQPARADANFGAESVAIAIRKASGSVVEDACRIHLLQKCARGAEIVGNDRVGVRGAKTLNVVDGLIHAAHNFQG